MKPQCRALNQMVVEAKKAVDVDFDLAYELSPKLLSDGANLVFVV